jgi:hypothetical protein
VSEVAASHTDDRISEDVVADAKPPRYWRRVSLLV